MHRALSSGATERDDVRCACLKRGRQRRRSSISLGPPVSRFAGRTEPKGRGHRRQCSASDRGSATGSKGFHRGRSMIAFLVAGTASGVGKTTVALAVMAAFRERGMIVQPFKCGPDFLDTGHHSAICGRDSRNLDTWMLDEAANKELFANACRGADVAIVEGMMGL